MLNSASQSLAEPIADDHEKRRRLREVTIKVGTGRIVRWALVRAHVPERFLETIPKPDLGEFPNTGRKGLAGG